MNRYERRIRLDAGAHASLGIVGTQFGSIREHFYQRAMLVARKNDARVFRKIGGRRKDLPFQDFRQNVGYAQRIPYSYRNMMNHRLVSPSLTWLSRRLPCSGMTPKFTVVVSLGWFRSLRHAPSCCDLRVRDCDNGAGSAHDNRATV